MTLLIDDRSPSKFSQGITSEITGEGPSIAPQKELTLVPLRPALEHYHVSVDWTDLNGYFQRLERKGTPINLGTYVGAGQVRQVILGDVDRAPAPAELEQMESVTPSTSMSCTRGFKQRFHCCNLSVGKTVLELSDLACVSLPR